MRDSELIGVRAIASHQEPTGKPRLHEMEAGAGGHLCQLAQHDIEVTVQTSLQWRAVFELTAKCRRFHAPGRAGVLVDVWQASPVGLYENQDSEQADMNLRGKLTTDSDGRFFFRSVMMVGYPIPTNGVVGRLLEAQNRHPYRPAHLHALIFKPGFKVLISQVYDPNDPHIDSDVQFGVTQALIGKFLRHETAHPTAPDVSAPWYSLDHTYRLEVGEAVLPRPPIK